MPAVGLYCFQAMSQPEILIVLPTLNEGPTIGRVIDEIPRPSLEAAGYKVRLLVVDGDSTDRTRQIAQEKGASIVTERRRGKGVAVSKALSAVDADFIFMLDADYTYPAGYIPEMLKLLDGHHAVVGSRMRGRREKGAMSRLNLVGNYLLSLIATVFYGKRISDVCSGYWGFRGEVVNNLHLRASAFDLEAEIFSQLTRRGYSIAEIPVDYRRRYSPPKLRSLRDGTRIGWALITRRFRRLDRPGEKAR
jgi:glycosyltransferase involved in cell wall biosynthesis